jgi:Tfp pilus assembly protein PilV
MKGFMHNQAGFSLAETIVSMAALGAILIGVGFEVQSIKASISSTERLMALDAMEIDISQMLSDKETVYYSIKKSSNSALKSCVFSDKTPCRNGKFYPVDLYLEGQNLPLSGKRVYYDKNANVCGTTCKDYMVKSYILVSCGNKSSCKKPVSLAFGFDIIDVTRKKSARKSFGEVKLSGLRRFVDLSVSCGSPQKILRGIGIYGQALCEKASAIVYKDEDGKPLKGSVNVQAKNCNALNTDPSKDQYFVTGLDNEGNIICGPRFW